MLHQLNKQHIANILGATHSFIYRAPHLTPYHNKHSHQSIHLYLPTLSIYLAIADHSIELSRSQHVEKQISREAKGKAPLLGNAVAYYPDGGAAGGGYKRGVSIFDLILRICGVATSIAAAAAMGTTGQTLPFFTQFFQFQANYDDIPTFQFFVIAMAIASGYLVLSISFSIVCIMRPHAAGPRFILIILDTVFVALTTAASGSAAAIVYLAHSGNSSANWLAICQQFNDFCQRTSGAVVAGFVSVVILMFLVVLSAIALRKY